MAATLASGASFGAALVAAGVYQPSVILSQLKFEDWHMLVAFLSATASSSLIALLLKKLNYTKPSPRSASSLGLLGPYDANILGGMLQGFGMGLSGACAGTVIAQAAVGVPSGLHALGGTLLGGIAWSGPISHLVASLKSNHATGPENPKLTVSGQLGLGDDVGAIIFQTLCFAAVYLVTENLTSTNPSRDAMMAPVVGGLCIGLAQLVSLVTRKTMMGTSTAYEEAGKYFWWIVSGARHAVPSAKNMLFAAGMALGARALVVLRPELAPVAAGGLKVPPWQAVLGGSCLALGSRLSGGCTSGHGISGMSLLSTSSFVTIGAMFGMGAVVASFGTIV